MNDYEHVTDKKRVSEKCADRYIASVEKRLNLQILCGFIRNGSTKTDITNKSFSERESEAYSKLKAFIDKKFGESEREEIMNHVNEYVDIIQEISFNLGMKAGAILQNNLLNNLQTDT